VKEFLRIVKIGFACCATHIALTMLVAVIYAAFGFTNYNFLMVYLCLGWILPVAFWRFYSKRLT
jgi:hypothetical protein